MASMIAIAGFVRVPLDKRAALQPHIETYVAACRAEPGCRAFDVSFDAVEPEKMRFFEVFDDEAAHAAHDATPHVAAWRAARAALGAPGRELTRYEIAASQPL
ncbi:MAG TPA: antibiotic biosynthesis monooxygenase [Caulobacterales bacterium]|nr:antibiotic biosynthesis monooxygenase [Caulobacterales bacterium]